ncbi:translation initiation factor-like protein [Leishmania panamensis]|uniref:Translation initiation factor-like protein n=3 Tax=Leishmania guyanensis species complex TaxID=38579 RepID=A0A088S320_LEIPA|nr:translation initiation factor-like protein [Leishmania panamensis]AIN95866.1 translation initiation factor-like protein [Leishmania panamensis]CCM13245.1 Putative translation initiation factor-like protein [Leishmania guyanensis]
MQRETGRQRRRNVDSGESSSEDEQQTTTTTVQDTVEMAPPVRVRAKAPAAAAVSAPCMRLHTDPTAPQVTAPAPVLPEAANSGGGSDDDALSPAVAQSNELAEEMEAINYDTLTYAALLEIMKRASRPAIEEIMAQREQQVESTMQQQQNQRVERFLDVAAASSAIALTDVNGSSAEDEAVEGYRYNAMLTRLFEALNRNNEGSAMTERNQLPVPILERMGKKKTVIANFGRICDAFHRPMEDVKDFIEKELSIRGNLDSNNALILKFEIRKQTDFDRVLIKYLDEYVKCNSCHRIDTTLTKDGRRLELRCNVCTATRTVTAAGTATFSAQIEKRSRQRAAMIL